MNTLPLDARIRWNRLRVMGALVRVEQDLTQVEGQVRSVRRTWRWSAPALAAAGLAWSLRARSGMRRGGRLISLALGARSLWAAFSQARRVMRLVAGRA